MEAYQGQMLINFLLALPLYHSNHLNYKCVFDHQSEYFLLLTVIDIQSQW